MSISRSCLLLSAALLLGLPSPSPAQVTRADSAAVLLSTALSFRAEGRWEVAEALLQHISERFRGTPAATQAMAALRAAPSSGRTVGASPVELQVWSTLYGAWLGVAIPGALGADDPGPFGAGLLVGGPAGFLAGRALARSRSLSEGQVRALTFGSLWGTWQGLGWAEVVDWGEKTRCDLDVCYVEDPDGEYVARSMVVGGLVGIGVGALLARKPIASGVATTVSFGGLWGTWFGLAGGVLAGLEGDDLLAGALLGGDGGLLATAYLAPTWNLTRERARLISIAGVVGGLGGAGLDLLLQPDDEKVAMAIPLLGSLAGLGLGAVWTGRRESDADRAGALAATPRNLPAGGGGGLAIRAAAVQVEEGRVRLGIPAPFPRMVQVEGPHGLALRPALGLTLLHARF